MGLYQFVFTAVSPEPVSLGNWHVAGTQLSNYPLGEMSE